LTRSNICSKLVLPAAVSIRRGNPMPVSSTSRASAARTRKPHPLDAIIREAMREAVARDEALHGRLPELRGIGAASSRGRRAERRTAPPPTATPAAVPTSKPLKGSAVRLRLPASKVAGMDAAGRLTVAATFRLLEDGRVEWRVAALYRGAGSKPLPDGLAARKLGDVAYRRWLPWPDARGRPARVRARTLDRDVLAGWLARTGVADPPSGG
jgi:hypothetical protein